MIKVIYPDSYNFDDPVASLVKVHSKGLDKSWMEKRSAAPEFLELFDGIKPKKDHSLIHLIAMGASDSYSTNRNGDGFFREPRKLDLPHANWRSLVLANGKTHTKSAETFTDHTDTGLIDRYKTFEKFAKVFKHHKNKPDKGDKIYGDVVAAAYNLPMDRVELLAEVPDNEWREELQKIAENKAVPFSMACIVSPRTPILTSTGYVAIEDVKVGDLVATHKNRWRKVTKLVRRKYTGDVCKITMRDFPFTLVLTSDHPMLASLSSQHAMSLSSQGEGEDTIKNKPIDNTGSDWLHVSHLKSGDWLMCTPPPAFPNVKVISSPSLGYLLGEALANTNQTLHAFKDEMSKHNVYGGIFDSDYDVKVAYLSGLLDSDACSVGKQVVCTFDDYHLMLQVRDLLHSCGIWNRVLVDTFNKDSKVTPIFKVIIPWEYCMPFLRFSTKLGSNSSIRETIKEAADGVADNYDLYLNYEIKKVDVISLADTQVYNLEIEEDHSYIMAGYVSHNCKVPYDICSECGHKGRNRNEYCEHLAHNLGTLTKEGRIVTAINDYETFFDISRVNRPADRIAWGLVKAAQSVLDDSNLALNLDESYEPDLDVIAASQPRKVADRIQLLQKLSEMEKEIPVTVHKIKTGINCKLMDDKKLETLAGKHEKMSYLLKALSENTIVLPLKPFAKLVFGNNEKIAKLADTAAPYLGSMFSIAFANYLTNTVSNLGYDSAYTTKIGRAHV